MKRYITLKTWREVEKMKKSGRLARRILDEMGRAAASGVSTYELDQMARSLCREAGAIPTFVGKKNPHRGGPPFPGAICASINEAVVHGVPTRDPLKPGDVLSLDFGCILDGWHGDTAWTYPIGTITEDAQKLLDITEQSLYEGIKQARAGNRTGDIGHAVQTYVEKHGCSVVTQLAGHGIGRELWEPPEVPNYGDPGTGAKLRIGMTIAIEPMVARGGSNVKWLNDGWTVITADRTLAAHFEHTVAILSDGPEILTVPE